MKLVSAILPTRGRREWALQALESFQAQTYPEKELIILDDIAEPSFRALDFLNFAGAFTLQQSTLRSIPEKRNRCCEMANGEIIFHLDSDDWSASDRMADQVERLEMSGKAVTGFSSMLFYDPSIAAWGRFVGDPFYALGSSLCYLKSWWQAHPFQTHLDIGEDNAFVHEANCAGQIESSPDFSKIVARVHPGNTSYKEMSQFRPIEPSMIPAGFPA